MASAEHRELVPLVEVSLAIMRLACEKFFVLISVLATYLLFRDEAPGRPGSSSASTTVCLSCSSGCASMADSQALPLPA